MSADRFRQDCDPSRVIPDTELAVLIVSCDRYKDLWPLCTSMLARFWPDCPYPIYLMSNEPAQFPGLRNLAIGPDKGWSANLIKALEAISEEYVLLFLEDLILERPVDSARVDGLFHWFKEARGNCLRMNPSPPADLPCNEMVGIASPLSLYRTSTVMTLWRRSVLIDLLDPAENAWQFEILGGARSDRYDGFYAAHVPTFAFINTVARGKWSRRAIRRVRRLGVEPDLQPRGVTSAAAEWKGRLMEVRSFLLRIVPSQYRRQVRQALIG
jgi:hypothetical protein